MKNIVFVNYYNKGDIHVSRGFVDQIIKKVKLLNPNISFFYGHKHDINLISDIDNLNFDPDALLAVHNECSKNHKNPQYNSITNIGDNIYISTWYAQQNKKYINDYGVTFDALYAALDDSCQEIWNFRLEDISKDPSVFYPKINYNKYKIDKAKKWLEGNSNKKIFIANGNAMSGQAINFNMSEIIYKLSVKYKNITFLLTNEENGRLKNNNIVYTSDIIGNNLNCDLNENAYLSSNCDIIIGRASGASSFALTYDNVFTKNNKFIYFCNMFPLEVNKFWLGPMFKDKINYKSNFIVSDTGDSNEIYNIIESNI